MPSLDSMKKIAEARTKGKWCHEALGEYGDLTLYVDNGKPNYEDWQIISEDIPENADIEFIAMAANNFDKLIKVVEAAKKVQPMILTLNDPETIRAAENELYGALKALEQE